jgi:hypothetical protein
MLLLCCFFNLQALVRLKIHAKNYTNIIFLILYGYLIV